MHTSRLLSTQSLSWSILRLVHGSLSLVRRTPDEVQARRPGLRNDSECAKGLSEACLGSSDIGSGGYGQRRPQRRL